MTIIQMVMTCVVQFVYVLPTEPSPLYITCCCIQKITDL